MDIKLYHKVAINLTEKEKFAISLTEEIIGKIKNIIDTHTKYTFEEFFEDVYNNDMIVFLYTLRKETNDLEEDINNLEEDF